TFLMPKRLFFRLRCLLPLSSLSTSFSSSPPPPLALRSLPTRRSSDLFLIEGGTAAMVTIQGDTFVPVPFRDLIDERHRHEGIALDRKSTRLNSSHQIISYAVFCLKKKKKIE